MFGLVPLLVAMWKICMSVQLTLEPHGFELQGSTYKQVFSNKYSTALYCMYFPYGFLNGFFSILL